MSDRAFLRRPPRWLLPLALLAAGCGPRAAAPDPVVVTVSPPVERPVTDTLDFSGRTEAVDSVELRARVTGYVQKVNFKDGDEVKKDQVLFEIDDRTFKADFAQAQANVRLVEAQVKEADAWYQRDLKLRPGNVVSAEEMEKATRSLDSAKATADAARADLKQQQLNLDYAKVQAPFSGRADKANVTVGNLVTADASNATVLTSIVVMKPMYVSIGVDEPTLLRLRQLVREHKLKPAAEKAPEVLFGVGRGNDYPFRATVDYISNEVEATTGTLPVRAVYPNEDRFLRPGLYARVRVPVGDPHPALLVTEQALMSNQGQKYLYVVNDNNEVLFRPVTLGAVDGGLRIITDGLKSGERVIIDGATRVRPGAVVNPKPAEMDAAPGKAAVSEESKPAQGTK
jgi:RND family efflux transporter MFP subunit